MTKKQLILNYLQDHKKLGLTSLDAIKMFGATRLSGVIFKLKEEGHNIRTYHEITVDRYGNKVRIARYKLDDGTL